ncbi:SPFH domain-containing protein [Erysipelothrix inopinata]|uniref:SPFH domain-containing protein n=1 Tax=Erysipelothrix inopinata TaxID=225084 RepID=A0A7G9RWM7_9FIRM|nr:SPFH domain-containing protein [Erysipelothrix inopinata]QNN60002.1 SPFH domain-containing protein [Erysipelothrix inopinata]
MAWIKDQFFDVIEYVDESDLILVKKFTDRESNEIKQGAKAIVREGQYGVFVTGGKLADILPPGTHTLDTGNLPVLSSLMAFPHNFNSPIKSDFYFVSTNQLVNNKWSTKNPIMMRDSDFGVLRLRAFGMFSFRINDVEKFMKEIFGSQKLTLTWDIITYLGSMVSSAFAESIAELQIPALDLGAKYKAIGQSVRDKVNLECQNLGLEFVNVNVENISLPEEVEKLIDEQSGIGLASKDMATFTQYQSVRAMRDASNQEGGLAGLGASAAFGNQIANTINQSQPQNQPQKPEVDTVEELLKYKKLLDEDVITKEEFDKVKARLLA